jgi:hypothetical protein
MRCSLFVPTDTLPERLRSRAYVPVEQQAVAAELAGLGALWLADEWECVPPRLPAALALARQLGTVTDGIELGLILRLPAPGLCERLLAELVALDDLSYGRLRIALDLRGLDAARHDAGLGLLEQLADRLDARRSPGLPRRLALVADEASAVPAAAGGFGLLLAPGVSLHSRRLLLARYHDQRGATPGWVARLLDIALAADEAELGRLRAAPPAPRPLLSPAIEAPLVGTPGRLVAELAVAQVADGLDEVICALSSGSPKPGSSSAAITSLGRDVGPLLRAGRRSNQSAGPEQSDQ